MIEDEVISEAMDVTQFHEYHDLRQQLATYDWLEQKLAPVLDADDVLSLMANVKDIFVKRFAVDRFGILVGTVNEKYCVIHEMVTRDELEACPIGSLMIVQGTGLEYIFRHRCLHYNPNIAANPEFIEDEELAATGLRSFVRIPLWHKNKVFGVMTVKSMQPNDYSDADLQLMAAVGRRLSNSIANLKLIYELKLKSYQDSLTGAFNRRFVEDVFRDEEGASLVEQMTAAELAEDNLLTVMFVDINNFKGLNDQEGHAVGDRVLTDTAKMIAEVVGESGFVARFGGDEFVAVLPGINEVDGIDLAVRMEERILRYNQENPAGTSWPLCISLGSATGLWSQFQDLLSVADKRMYGNKA